MQEVGRMVRQTWSPAFVSVWLAGTFSANEAGKDTFDVGKRLFSVASGQVRLGGPTPDLSRALG